MSAPDRIWAWRFTGYKGSGSWSWSKVDWAERSYLAEDGPTITAYREALRARGVDPDEVAREAEKEAQ